MYVIRRCSDGKMVAQPGSKHSYTQYLQRARIFKTTEEADGDRCIQNEYIEKVDLLK
jgi:hypothetical protein